MGGRRRQCDEIFGLSVVAAVVGEEGEVVHGSGDAAVGGLAPRAVLHGQELSVDELAGDAERGQHMSELVGKRAASDDPGARGMNTGSRVVSLANSATCGRHGSALAHQLPGVVAGASIGVDTVALTRRRSFFVAWIEETRLNLSRVRRNGGR